MVEERLERIEKKIDTLANAVTQLGVGVADRFIRVDASLFALDEKMDNGFQRLDAKTDRIEKALDSIQETQSNINSELSDQVQKHEHRIGNLEARRP